MLKFDVGILIVFMSLIFKSRLLSFTTLLALLLSGYYFNLITLSSYTYFNISCVAIVSLSFVFDIKYSWERSRYLLIFLILIMLCSLDNYLSLFLIYIYTIFLKFINYEEKKNSVVDVLSMFLFLFLVVFYKLASGQFLFREYVEINEFYINIYFIFLMVFVYINFGGITFYRNNFFKEKDILENSLVNFLPRVICIYLLDISNKVLFEEINYKLISTTSLIFLLFYMFDCLKQSALLIAKPKTFNGFVMNSLLGLSLIAFLNNAVNITLLMSGIGVILISIKITGRLKRVKGKFIGSIFIFFTYISLDMELLINMYGKINHNLWLILVSFTFLVSYCLLKSITVNYGSKICNQIQKPSNNESVI
jgi:hypothetical protein